MHESLIREACDLDDQLRTLPLDDEYANEVRAYLFGLEEELNGPFIGRQVSLIGEAALPEEVDNDGQLALSFTGQTTVVEGTYKGIYVFPFYHRLSDGSYHWSNRVVHRIELPTEVSGDNLGGRTEHTPSCFIAVTGSKLELDSVTDTHSLRFLEGESNWLAGSIAESVDAIANSELPASKKVTDILQYLSINLADIQRDHELMRNVLSYVNSLGLFDDIEILSQAFIYNNGEEAVRFSKNECYHLCGIDGITIKDKLMLGDGTALLSDKHIGIFFSLLDIDFGQVLIPYDDSLMVVLEKEDG